MTLEALTSKLGDEIEDPEEGRCWIGFEANVKASSILTFWDRDVPALFSGNTVPEPGLHRSHGLVRRGCCTR